MIPPLSWSRPPELHPKRRDRAVAPGVRVKLEMVSSPQKSPFEAAPKYRYVGLM
jgi:hypothetical protein